MDSPEKIEAFVTAANRWYQTVLTALLSDEPKPDNFLATERNVLDAQAEGEPLGVLWCREPYVIGANDPPFSIHNTLIVHGHCYNVRHQVFFVINLDQGCRHAGVSNPHLHDNILFTPDVSVK